jgi:hypothetical protein
VFDHHSGTLWISRAQSINDIFFNACAGYTAEVAADSANDVSEAFLLPIGILHPTPLPNNICTVKTRGHLKELSFQPSQEIIHLYSDVLGRLDEEHFCVWISMLKSGTWCLSYTASEQIARCTRCFPRQ